MRKRDREQAEALYCHSQLGLEEIEERNGIPGRTLRSWKAKFDWDKKRETFLAKRTSSAASLEELIHALESEIKADLKNKIKPAAGRMFALKGFRQQLRELNRDIDEEINDEAEAPDDQKKPPLTVDHFLKIEQELFGLYEK